MNQDNFNNIIESDNNSPNIKHEIAKYLVHWKWFILGIIISIIGGFIYLRYTTPKYNAVALIMIKDNLKSGISDEFKAVSDLGIVGKGSTNNPANEIEILKSRKIIGAVVDSLDLNFLYYVEGIVKKTEVYNKTPVKIRFVEKTPLFSEIDTTLVVSIKNKTQFNLINNLSKEISTHTFNDTIRCNLGAFIVTKNLNNFDDNSDEFFVVLSKKNAIIDKYKSLINIIPVDDDSSVLKLSLSDVVKQKAEDILNELIIQYNLDAVSDKNQVSEKTKEFIDERLKSIGLELQTIQDKVKNYKLVNSISGLSKEGELALVNSSKSNDRIVSLKSELILAESIQKLLNKASQREDILPTNLGFTDSSISKTITNYNNLIINKNKLSITAGFKNPELIQFKSQISNLRANLKSSFNNLINSLKIKLNQLNNEALKINSKVSLLPVIERGIIDIEREEDIFAGLYSYLLKKKEETAISLAVTVPNAKIIDIAYGSNSPVFPKKSVIYLLAIIVGLLVPFIIIYIKNLLDTKIHSRKDVEEMTNIPFLGDIPHSEIKEKIIINSTSRSSSAEAFRLIRTNLDFMLPPKLDSDLGKTIFITSTTSGEGKSFISINLAVALSLSNKKVLLLGMDLRAPKVTEYLGVSERRGITNYITNDKLLLDDLKFNLPEIKGLDVLASGVMPPNPSELLLTERVKELFEKVKKEYDYIIVDTAPVNLVTDTLLISKYADMFLYVARANYLDKAMLMVPQTLYKEKKLPNMAIVLNDTNINKGYGYVDTVKKPWYKKIF